MTMRQALLILAVAGTLLFAGAFALSHAQPLLVERAARGLVEIEVERRVGARIDGLTDARIAGFAVRALQRVDVDAERTRQAIRDELPRRVAAVVSAMLQADCACRARIGRDVDAHFAARLADLAGARARLDALVESAYASVAHDLLREFRIVTGSNAVAFALLGLVALRRRGAALQLVLPAVVLVGAVAITSAFYVFRQDWLHTLVFGDYVGLAYAGWLAAVALQLADIVLNRARVTTRVVNVLMHAVGSAGIPAPC